MTATTPSSSTSSAVSKSASAFSSAVSPQSLASGWDRIVAATLDGVITSTPMKLCYVWLLLSANAEQFVVTWVKSMVVLFSLVWVALLYRIGLRAKYQRTVGMYCLGLSLTSTTGQKLAWQDILFRELLGKAASFYLFGFGLLGAWRHPLKQTWHDRLVDSVVVRSGEPRPTWLKGLVFGAALALEIGLWYFVIRLALVSPVVSVLKTLLSE